MTIKIERGRKKTRRRTKKRRGIGFTNLFALLQILYHLFCTSCTVVFTPIGTAIGIVLNSIVRKSEAENTGADGEGIKYAAAKAAGFTQTDAVVEDSPAI